MASRGSSRKKPIVNGWLIVDKPAGMTSTSVSNTIKRLTGGAKTGHGGTLDPLATGVLPIALGEATKTVSYVMDGRKSYSFSMRWGVSTDTDDADGTIVETSDVRPGQAAIEESLAGFRGAIEQTPPAYSALKIDGKRAYDLARNDKPVELPSRKVDVYRFDYLGADDPDHGDFIVECGKGTYIRSLARDLARALGTVGHVTALRRTRVGPFHESAAIPLDNLIELEHIPPEFDRLLPVKTALDDIPALAVSGGEAVHLRNGQVVPLFRKSDLVRTSCLEEGAIVRAEQNGRLVALARFGEGRIQPVRVLHL